MLQASERNPKITNLIHKIKAYLKESVLVERSAKLVLRDKFRQESALYLPLFRQWQEQNASGKFKDGFRYFLWSNKTDELKKKEQEIWNVDTYLHRTEECELVTGTEFDLTLLHILYNRLRHSTKFHLGSKEKEDAYIKSRGQFRHPNGEGYVSLCDFYAHKLSQAYEVPLEAFAGGCHAS